MQNKSFQDLVDVFNSNAITSPSNQDKMGLLALRYALLTRHKATGVDDTEKTALAQTMMDGTQAHFAEIQTTDAHHIAAFISNHPPTTLKQKVHKNG